VAEHAPVQLLRIGSPYLIGVPAEVTIVAGLRLRRAVATVVGAELDRVLVAGYSNGYLHYLTTPEEYDSQQYEGGATLFGRWELPAIQQTVVRLAEAMARGQPAPTGERPPRLTGRSRFGTRPAPARRPAAGGGQPGTVIRQPAAYRPGDRVEAVFAAAHPNNNSRRGDSYLEVQRADADGGWVALADDGDWSTRFRWSAGRRGWAVAGPRGPHTVTISWEIPVGTAGRFRLRYRGDDVTAGGVPCPVIGTSSEFTVRPDPDSAALS
jgi:neutral ceramidase